MCRQESGFLDISFPTCGPAADLGMVVFTSRGCAAASGQAPIAGPTRSRPARLTCDTPGRQYFCRWSSAEGAAIRRIALWVRLTVIKMPGRLDSLRFYPRMSDPLARTHRWLVSRPVTKTPKAPGAAKPHCLISIPCLSSLSARSPAAGRARWTWRLLAKATEASLREFPELKNGPPRHDTFSRLFRNLDPDRLLAAFQRFMAALRRPAWA